MFRNKSLVLVLIVLLWILCSFVPITAYQKNPSKSRTSTTTSKTTSASTSRPANHAFHQTTYLHNIDNSPALSILRFPTSSFSSSTYSRPQSRRNIHRYQRIFRLQAAMNSNNNNDKSPKFEVTPISVSIPLGPGYDSMTYQFRPLFQNSTFVVVTYQIPFDLSLEKPPKGFPAPIVTKDNTMNDENREKQGDVLRATTSWSQSYLTGNGGWASDIMNVAGNVKWKRAIYDTVNAPWEEVLKALQSNVERSDEVTLVFERAIDTETEKE